MTAPSVTIDLLAYNFNLETTDFLSPFGNSLIGKSFLHELAREGDILTAEIVIDTGAEVDLPDDQGRRPLHEAALAGREEMVAFLLDCGAPVDALIHPFEHTALWLAVECGHFGTAALLIKRGAGLAVADALLGQGLLHLAGARGDMRLAGLLISSGINIFREDNRGLTARDHAARAGHRELEQVLLKVMAHQAAF